jgi:hypothetical protein
LLREDTHMATLNIQLNSGSYDMVWDQWMLVIHENEEWIWVRHSPPPQPTLPVILLVIFILDFNFMHGDGHIYKIL